MYEEIEFEAAEGQVHIPARHKKNALVRSPFRRDKAEDVQESLVRGHATS